MTKKITTRSGVNYGIWWLGWKYGGFWFDAFIMNAGTKTLPRRDPRGYVITIGLGLFAIGRGY